MTNSIAKGNTNHWGLSPPLTKEETLIKCYRLWMELGRTGRDCKGDAYEQLGFKADLNGCPCCEFSRVGIYEVDCKLCPVDWGEKARKDKPQGYYCEYKKSYYSRWCMASSPTARSNFAYKLANQIKEQMNKAEIYVS